jgi:hypothetical protein
MSASESQLVVAVTLGFAIAHPNLRVQSDTNARRHDAVSTCLITEILGPRMFELTPKGIELAMRALVR